MGFELPKLDYEYNALEPHIDEKTMTIHHTKHHQAYVDKLNKAVEGTELADKEISEILKDVGSIPEDVKKAVVNNGGQHFNHSFLWKSLSPNGGEPEGKLLDAINAKFGSLEDFKKEFSEKAATLFGSGWCWLVSNNGELEIVQTSNAGCPLSDGKVPLLVIDVWEHSYYLLRQNRRPEFIEAFWNVVNWKEVESRMG
ncbi:superoxide dismutase [Nanoarchaeota archaeon]